MKLICPNCEEDITYIYNKGRVQAIEEFEKILNTLPKNKDFIDIKTKRHIRMNDIIEDIKQQIQQLKSKEKQ